MQGFLFTQISGHSPIKILKVRNILKLQDNFSIYWCWFYMPLVHLKSKCPVTKFSQQKPWNELNFGISVEQSKAETVSSVHWRGEHNSLHMSILFTGPSHYLDQYWLIIYQMTFSNASFSWMKSFVFQFEFHWHMCPIDNKSALVQVMAWRWSGDKPLPEPRMTQFTDAYMRH